MVIGIFHNHATFMSVHVHSLSVELAARDNPRQQSTNYDDRKNDSEGMWYFEIRTHKIVFFRAANLHKKSRHWHERIFWWDGNLGKLETNRPYGDRGSDWNPFTCVRVGGRRLLLGSKSLQIGSKFAPGGAWWVGSKLGWKARRHSGGKCVGGAGPPKSKKENKINRDNKYIVAKK